jgi:hypothetical protein
LILSQILHDWDDERADAILTNCRRAVRTGGRLLLVEGVIQDGSEPDFLKLLDLHMPVMFGGKERTESEWRALLTAAGFQLTHVVPTGLIEARPPDPTGSARNNADSAHKRSPVGVEQTRVASPEQVCVGAVDPPRGFQLVRVLREASIIPSARCVSLTTKRANASGVMLNGSMP